MMARIDFSRRERERFAQAGKKQVSRLFAKDRPRMVFQGEESLFLFGKGNMIRPGKTTVFRGLRQQSGKKGRIRTGSRGNIGSSMTAPFHRFRVGVREHSLRHIIGCTKHGLRPSVLSRPVSLDDPVDQPFPELKQTALPLCYRIGLVFPGKGWNIRRRPDKAVKAYPSRRRL